MKKLLFAVAWTSVEALRPVPAGTLWRGEKVSRIFLHIWCAVLLLLSADGARCATFNIANGDIAGLVAAINASNGNGQDDTINLATGGTYTLTTVNNTTEGATGLPVIDIDLNFSTGLRSLTINGNGATVERSTTSGTPEFRILHISAATDVRISNLTIADGNVRSGTSTNGAGGGIYIAHAVVTLNNCTITDNTAQAGGGIYINGQSASGDDDATVQLTNCTIERNSGGADGGGVMKTGGTLAVNGCTFYYNSLRDTDGGAGIYNQGGSLVLRNSTFFFNQAGRGVGGALYNRNTRTATLVQNCTMARNTASQGGECISNSSGSTAGTAELILTNNILEGADHHLPVATLRGPGVFSSGGYNISTDGGAGFLTGTADQINTDPKLDPADLQDNGGPTKTIALATGSPAVDHGRDASGGGVDQRGQPRPRDIASIPNGISTDGSDVGAFESLDPVQPRSDLSVNTLADHDDGICGAVDCTLREAIAVANASPGRDAITIPLQGVITLGALGQLVISDALMLNGPGARLLALSGAAARRVFNISSRSPVYDPAPSSISGLTIREGISYSTQFSAGRGAGVLNTGEVTFSDCAFVGNFAYGRDGGPGATNGGFAFGGAAHNTGGGTLTFDRCTFASNGADGGLGAANTGSGTFGGAGGLAQGGAIYNDVSSTLTLNNCTLANNSATGGSGGSNTTTNGRGGNGGVAKGGGIFNRGPMTLTSCTLRANNSSGGSGGLGGSAANNGTAGTGAGGVTSDAGATTTLRNTLIAQNSGNAGVDANGEFTSAGYNLIGNGDFGSGFSGPADQVGTTAAPIDPKLGALQDYGGPTDTIALLTNSPALDQGKAFGLINDQRARSRPLDTPAISPPAGGDSSDIGAFESSGRITPSGLFSRKTHGGTASFDIDLHYGSSTPGIECRSGGATSDYELIVIFPFPVSVTGSPQAAVTSGSAVIGSNGSANGGSVGVDGSTITIPLTNVANAQTCVVRLNGVSDGINNNIMTLSAGVLLGDTNGNGSVNASDIGQTKAQSGQALAASNFRSDVNANGAINASDIGLVKSKSGTALP